MEAQKTSASEKVNDDSRQSPTRAAPRRIGGRTWGVVTERAFGHAPVISSSFGKCRTSHGQSKASATLRTGPGSEARTSQLREGRTPSLVSNVLKSPS